MSAADPYSERVRALFASPAHAGTLDGPAVRVDDQGVRIEISAISGSGRLEKLAFRAYGCPHLIAAVEAFCAEYEGCEPAALEGFSGADLMHNLPVPHEKTGRILVLEDAVRSLGAKRRDSQ